MSHDHSHAGHHHQPGPVSQRATVMTLAALIPCALATLLGLILLWPGSAVEDEPWAGPDPYTGTVDSVQLTSCVGNGVGTSAAPGQQCGTVTVTMHEGPDAGLPVDVPVPSGPGAPTVTPGDDVVLIYNEATDQPGIRNYDITDHQRGNGLWLLVGGFALAVLAFGRLRGLTALLGLGFTFAVLLVFILPAILQGSPPLLVAITGSAAIMLVVLYLTHGISIPTSMAVLGTLTSLTLTGLLAAVSTSMLHFTGIANEEAMLVSFLDRGISMQGLLLAGVLIGCLGVLDDVTVTQAYTVTELAHANPTLGFRSLYAAASRVGRAHITSVINTIVLAYAGASLPTLLLLTAGGRPWSQTLTSEFLAQEIVRSIVGTLGLISAVPITTALAALAASRSRSSSSPAPRHRHADPLERAWGLDR